MFLSGWVTLKIFLLLKAGGLPGTDIGFWGGNTYPVSDAMSGPNNVRMYGTWDITNSYTGKEATFKHYVC